MVKPNYLVLYPGNHVVEFARLADALEAQRRYGTVYERLGHHVGVSVDHEYRLLAALKSARAAMTNQRYLKPRIGMEAECALCDAVISEVEAYQAEYAQAMEDA